MPTRAVLFDLGNTLVSYYRAPEFPTILRQCLMACLEELGLAGAALDGDLHTRALALNRETPEHTVWPLGERLAVLFPDRATDPPTLARLSRAFLEPIFATARLDPEALPLLAALRASGIRTAIVSNTPWGSQAQAWRAELSRHGLLAAVDATVFCVDAGHRKPHPAPIERALGALGVSPKDAIFVGDDVRWDVAGARAAGVRPVLIAPAGTADLPSDVSIIHSLRSVPEHLGSMHDGGT